MSIKARSEHQHFWVCALDRNVCAVCGVTQGLGGDAGGEGGMRTYTLKPRLDGNWIYIYVPELDYGTQARRVDEIEKQGRDLIATVLGIGPEDFAVRILDLAPELLEVKGEARS